MSAQLSQPDFGPLSDIAVLALIVGHGMDGHLDPSESSAIVDQLHALAPDALGHELSGNEAMHLMQRAAEGYKTVRIEDLDEVVRRIAGTLNEALLQRAFEALVAVASADGHAHPMESTVLRHLHQAWELPPMGGSGA
jgi:tellurite resistance protein